MIAITHSFNAALIVGGIAAFVVFILVPLEPDDIEEARMLDAMEEARVIRAKAEQYGQAPSQPSRRPLTDQAAGSPHYQHKGGAMRLGSIFTAALAALHILDEARHTPADVFSGGPLLPQSKRGVMVTIEQTPEMAELYRAGWSQDWIAERLGIAQSTVHYHLRKQRESVDHPAAIQGGCLTGRWIGPCAYNEAGATTYEIAQVMGRDHSSISERLQRAGVPLRSRSEIARLAWRREAQTYKTTEIDVIR